jgi:anti-anti-sigma factor
VDPFVISVVGELDMAREHEILNLVITLDPAPESTVHVDMSEVSFVDSGGINALLKAKAYLKGRHCELRIVNPQQQLIKIIDLVGLRDSLVVERWFPGQSTTRSSPKCGRTEAPPEDG